MPRAAVAAIAVVLASRAARAEPDPGAEADANAGHVWIVPTALVPAAGTFSIEDIEVAAIGVSYALTDRVIASATVLYIPAGGTDLEVLASIKAQVVRTPRLRLAVLAGAYTNSVTDSERATVALFGDVAGAATVCIDAGCASHIDATVGVGYGRDTTSDASEVPLGFGAAGVVRLLGPLKLLLEVDQLWNAQTVTGHSRMTVAWAGVRYAVSHFGVDAGWGECFRGEGDCGRGVGFPVLQLAVRW